MLCFRIASPLCWIGAAILFFLPWIEISCTPKSGPEERFTFSGAQLVWGGRTKQVNGEITEYVLVGHGPPTIKAGGLAFLLTAYIGGLITCIFWVGLRRPSRDRALRGLVVAIVLTAVLFGAFCYMFEGEPFPREHDEALFTRWYVLSYVANGLAIALFAIEWQYFKTSRCEATESQ
jgi:hypothetical protein